MRKFVEMHIVSQLERRFWALPREQAHRLRISIQDDGLQLALDITNTVVSAHVETNHHPVVHLVKREHTQTTKKAIAKHTKKMSSLCVSCFVRILRSKSRHTETTHFFEWVLWNASFECVCVFFSWSSPVFSPRCNPTTNLAEGTLAGAAPHALQLQMPRG